jgi:hypothetical protein
MELGRIGIWSFQLRDAREGMREAAGGLDDADEPADHRDLQMAHLLPDRIIGAIPGLREGWDREEREMFLSSRSMNRSDSPRARPSGSNVAATSCAVGRDGIRVRHNIGYRPRRKRV